MKESFVHATLIKGGLVLLASDMVGDRGLIKGNSVSLMLNYSSEEEIKTYYENLVAGGEADHQLEISFWGLYSAI